MNAFVIIPARLESSRLPNKLLLRETGMSVLHHTFTNAFNCPDVSGVCVATDSDEIIREVNSFQGFAIRTGKHLSGTSRVVEACDILGKCCHLPDFLLSNIVINLQADEPSLTSDDLSKLIESMTANLLRPEIGSLYFGMSGGQDVIDNPDRVKVVVDNNGCAMYFSRYGIPYEKKFASITKWLQHVGVYAFRKSFIPNLSTPSWAESGLQGSTAEYLPDQQGSNTYASEDLEQLYWLEQGYKIQMSRIDHETNGIDTREDYDLFLEEWKCRK